MNSTTPRNWPAPEQLDFLTDTLTALALARAGLGKWTPFGTLLLLLSLNLPDLDNLSSLRGPLAQIKQHAGYTHCLLALPLLAAFCVFLVAAGFRRRLQWFRAGLLCCFGVACHLLLDALTPYGFRPLLPFSSAWFHLDISGAFDPVALTVLATTLTWPYFSRLVSSEIGGHSAPGRGSAITGLVVVTLFEIARAVLHAQATAQLEARLFDGAPPIRLAAIPDSRNPLRWTAVVETAGADRVLPVDSLTTFDPEAGKTFYKSPETPAIRAAKQTEPFRYFAYFARFPLWDVEPVLLEAGEGQRVELLDLSRANSPASIAIVDRAGNHLLKSWFTRK